MTLLNYRIVGWCRRMRAALQALDCVSHYITHVCLHTWLPPDIYWADTLQHQYSALPWMSDCVYCWCSGHVRVESGALRRNTAAGEDLAITRIRRNIIITSKLSLLRKKSQYLILSLCIKKWVPSMFKIQYYLRVKY